FDHGEQEADEHGANHLPAAPRQDVQTLDALAPILAEAWSEPCRKACRDSRPWPADFNSRGWGSTGITVTVHSSAASPSDRLLRPVHEALGVRIGVGHRPRRVILPPLLHLALLVGRE